MRIRTSVSLLADMTPILDEEFDKVVLAPSLVIHPVFSRDLLAWEDQLDNGEELSV